MAQNDVNKVSRLDERLARILWQCAKMLVSLLDKEYNLSKSNKKAAP